MNEELRTFDLIFALQWLVTSALALVLGGFIAFSTIWSAGELVENLLGETVAVLVMGALFGGIIGLSASLGPGWLLRKKGIDASSWLIASVVAGALGMAVGITTVFSLQDIDAMPQTLTGLVMGLSLGLPLGVGQWLVLRQQGLQAPAWVLISTVAFVAGLSLGLPLGGEGRELLSLGVVGLVVGGVTGLGMMWSLRQETAPTLP